MPSTIYLMLRSAHRARLEARTTWMQALVRCLQRFFHTLVRWDDQVAPPSFGALEAALGSYRLVQLVEREVELEHVDPLLAEDAEKAVLGHISDQVAHFLLR
jgi:hypothetical protein